MWNKCRCCLPLNNAKPKIKWCTLIRMMDRFWVLYAYMNTRQMLECISNWWISVECWTLCQMFECMLNSCMHVKRWHARRMVECTSRLKMKRTEIDDWRLIINWFGLEIEGSYTTPTNFSRLKRWWLREFGAEHWMIL